VRKCWLKNLVKKIKEWPLRASIFEELGHIMNMRSDPNNNLHDIMMMSGRSYFNNFILNFQVKKLSYNILKLNGNPKLVGLFV
jgi:hypothetical protein